MEGFKLGRPDSRTQILSSVCSHFPIMWVLPLNSGKQRAESILGRNLMASVRDLWQDDPLQSSEARGTVHLVTDCLTRCTLGGGGVGVHFRTFDAGRASGRVVKCGFSDRAEWTLILLDVIMWLLRCSVKPQEVVVKVWCPDMQVPLGVWQSTGIAAWEKAGWSPPDGEPGTLHV